MQELQIGCTLQNGRYCIERVLGYDGFGITYQGETAAVLSGELGNINVKMMIAIKEFFMRDSCIRSEDGISVTVPAKGSRQQVQKYKDNFIREARNLANTRHRNVIDVNDVFEENNTVYYVMQYLPSGSMTDKVKNNESGRLSTEEAIRYIRQIAAALTYLHDEKHMCHLGVKPANILLSSEGEAILTDFGITKTFDDTNCSKNTSSVSYGNNYAPLEQYLSMKHFSPQTDIYSLGATFYYMLTGNTPPEASELMENGFPKCPYFVTPHVWHALEKAMQPRKKDRPESVVQWIEMLDVKRAIDIPNETPVSSWADSEEIIVGTSASLDKKKMNTGKDVDMYPNKSCDSITYGSKPRARWWSRIFKKRSVDEIYSSIFAPAEVKCKSHILVQVYLHLFEETEKIKALAQESQKDAVRRDYIPLQCKLKKGDKVNVLLNIFGETLMMSDNKDFVWQGFFTKCSFDYFVPKDIDVDELSCVALLSVNGVPVGEMRFITKIVEKPRQLNPEILAHKYSKVFISYSHQDESKVKFLHEGLELGGIPHFFDRHNLKVGDVFPQVIQDYINSADLFILCWSENASKSEYVQKERLQALERAFPQVRPEQAAKLRIYPMSIEPRAELPSDMKNYYHFGEM